ncbi:dihydrofolate reductase [Spirosoma sp. HMF3257]|uniref:Dihydrofolate reductase n=1 Tax=Spirosoma telluris TaxID=2183553 RepID=A0A327NJ02_9BACT|nr:dihydrofolate reductase [Spirosoma telluris]RAI74319.1 dihydrofolate reductase [Spirosoma telluris]
MRSVILSLAVSLDGYIEGPSGEYDWCFTDQDYGMTAFLARIDALFMGRKTYELLTNPDEAASNYTFPDYKKYIFSNTLQEVDNGVELIRGDIKPQVDKLKNQPGKDIWLFGGADLTATFLREGLVDELSLAIHPILLGGGKSLFMSSKDRIKLTLIESKTYSTGLVLVSYKLK